MNTEIVRCQNCGAPNRLGVRFCGNCGAPLGAAYYVPPSPPTVTQKKGSPWWMACLVGFLAISCCLLLVVGGAGAYYYLFPLLATPPSSASGPTGTSVTLTSSESGMVTSESGVSIVIPVGAVPVREDGSPGTMIFNIEEVATTPSLPEGFVPLGPVVNVGPEGFVFEQPVTLFFPIPSDIGLDMVLGAAYYDPGQGTWNPVFGAVDEVNRVVEVATTHFSLWTIFGPSLSNFQQNGGWFKVYRPPDSVGYSGPNARYGQAQTSHGICIVAMNWTNPDPRVSNWWTAPEQNLIVASNWPAGYFGINVAPSSDAAKYWMPSGTYTLIETYAQSEFNVGMDPTYLPRFWSAWRNLGMITVNPGQTVEFPVPDLVYGQVTPESGWTFGRPPCWGVATTAVGVGDLQVTLTWRAHADIDLHVVEPTGERISYQQTTSSSGGTLDRDNQCADFEMGRPENIFWPTPPAGTYEIYVDYYADCGNVGAVQFTVRICKKGVCTTRSGQVASEDDTVTFSFTYP